MPDDEHSRRHRQPSGEPARVYGDEDLAAGLEHERRRGEHRCQCAMHAGSTRSGAAQASTCVVTLPGQLVCLCSLFRLVRGHQLGDV